MEQTIERRYFAIGFSESKLYPNAFSRLEECMEVTDWKKCSSGIHQELVMGPVKNIFSRTI